MEDKPRRHVDPITPITHPRLIEQRHEVFGHGRNHPGLRRPRLLGGQGRDDGADPFQHQHLVREGHAALEAV